MELFRTVIEQQIYNPSVALPRGGVQRGPALLNRCVGLYILPMLSEPALHTVIEQ